MYRYKLIVNKLVDTYKFCNILAKNLSKNEIITLESDLGCGKTAICRYIIRTLFIRQDLEITSPTFPIVQTYENDILKILHYDLYRLNCENDLFNIGFHENIDKYMMLIEWPLIAWNILKSLNIIQIKIELHQQNDHYDIENEQRIIWLTSYKNIPLFAEYII